MGTDSCAETPKMSLAIRHPLTSIMFHYRDQSQVACKWPGAQGGFRGRSFSGSLRRRCTGLSCTDVLDRREEVAGGGVPGGCADRS